MAEAQNSNTEVPPHAQLVQMAMAHWVSRIVHLAAKLGLADYLADGPKSAEELAAPTATLAPSLYRPDADAFEPRHSDRVGDAPFRIDTARRGAEERGAGLGARQRVDDCERLVVPRIRRA